MIHPIILKHVNFFKSTFILPLLCLSLLFSISCQKQQETSGPPEKITIAYSTAANAILVDIAFAEGYFAEEGLDAMPQPHPYGKPALASVIEETADVATVADTPIVLAIMNGEQITTLATIQTSNRDAAIVATRNHGIMSPADLKGKRIGVTLGTSIEFFTDAYLIAHDISRNDVTIIDMRPAEMPDALEAGRVDAVSAFAPTLTLLEQALGKSGSFFYDESIYTENFCVVARQDYIKNHPGAARKFLRALIKSETYIQGNPGEAKGLVADFLKLEPALLEKIWPIFITKVTLDQSLLVDLEDQSRWAVKKGLTSRKDMPNYLDFIYFDGLLAVKPEAVTILR